MPAVPRREPQESIGPEDQRQAAIGVLGPQLLERQYRKAAAGPLDLTRIDLESFVVGDCKFYHRQPLAGGRDRRCTMRWVAGRHEPDSAQTESLGRLTRKLEMSVVDRIEGPAENAENAGHGCEGSDGAPLRQRAARRRR